jgi:hypothetical protein
MNTLFNHPDGPSQYRIKVILCVSPDDFEESDDTLEAMFAEAQESGRLVGCIVRHFGGNSYFTYYPWQQKELEISLLAALTTPRAETYVTQG